MPPSIFAGTSGFSYKEWKGSFYPDKLADKKLLAHYAERLSTVELNNTFYRMPRTKVVEAWRDQTPPAFRFAIKASRRITHLGKLQDVDDPLSYLLEVTQHLGSRLGVILFQLPPYLRKDVPRLEAFLDVLAGRAPVAFEFRHRSWFDDEVLTLLADRDVALCCGDTDGDDLPHEPVQTAPHGYVRLRRPTYDDAALAVWADRLSVMGWSHGFAYFKHETEGPALALRLAELLAERGAGPAASHGPGIIRARSLKEPRPGLSKGPAPEAADDAGDERAGGDR